MSCYHCGAITTNGLALCDLCQRKAAVVLEFLPAYFRNLARWKPGRAGSRPVPGSRVLYDGDARHGTGDRISDAVDEAVNALTTWARALADDRPDMPRPLTFANAVLLGDLPDVIAEELADDQPLAVAWLCIAFEHHLTTVATLAWCGEFVRELGTHEQRLRSLTEAAVPGWYAGSCRRRISMDSDCGAPTYVIPGLTWVTCSQCGATTYARDHLETILGEARPWVARPMRLAEAVVALVDTEQSVPRLHKRISKWGERGRIDVVRAHDHAPKRYRLGDVLDRLATEGATRPDAERVEEVS